MIEAPPRRPPTAKVSWRHQLFLLRRAVRALPYWARMPGVQVDAAFPGIDELEVCVTHRHSARGLPQGDAYVLSLITAYLQPRRIFEIGTAAGLGTVLMARQAPEAKIETLDLGEATPTFQAQRADPPMKDLDAVGRAFRGTPFAERITQHFGDSVTFDYSPFEGEMDLVFVDGSHALDFVRADSRTALSLIGESGVVIWDDCHLYHPGVSRGLLELRREGHEINRIEATRFAVLAR